MYTFKNTINSVNLRSNKKVLLPLFLLITLYIYLQQFLSQYERLSHEYDKLFRPAVSQPRQGRRPSKAIFSIHAPLQGIQFSLNKEKPLHSTAS